MKRLTFLLTALVSSMVSTTAFADESDEPDDDSGAIIALRAAGSAIGLGPSPLMTSVGVVGLATGNDALAWMMLPIGGFGFARSAARKSGDEDLATGLFVTDITLRVAGSAMVIAARIMEASHGDDDVAALPIMIAPVITPTGGALTIGVTF